MWGVGGGYAARLFFLFFFFVQQTTSGIGQRVKQFFRVVSNQYVECENNNNIITILLYLLWITLFLLGFGCGMYSNVFVCYKFFRCPCVGINVSVRYIYYIIYIYVIGRCAPVPWRVNIAVVRWGFCADYVVKFASPSCVCFISFGFLLATICVWV